MKKINVWDVIGCILGVVVMILGIYFAATPAESYETSTVRSCAFGADFYTEVYKGVDTAVDNTATTANNIREVGAKLALYSGTLFLVLGALIVIHFAKQLALARVTPAALSPSGAEPLSAETLLQHPLEQTCPAPGAEEVPGPEPSELHPAGQGQARGDL